MTEPIHQPAKLKGINDSPIKQDNSNIDLTNLETLRRIISLSSAKNSESNKNELSEREYLLAELLILLCNNRETGSDVILLTSHSYLSLLKALSTPSDFENRFKKYLNLQSDQIIEFKKIYHVHNVELFKLIICNGFLQLGDNLNLSHSLYKVIFETIHWHCIKYTRYTYFAFKILQIWMQRTSKTSLWSEDCSGLEEKLESIIFSNWDNTICKANIIATFTTYLDIMKKKYDDFMPYLFYNCVERISWCHVTKYMILAEVCYALDDVKLMIEKKFLTNLFNSLTVTHLCSASTKVYNFIINKLSKDLWQRAFGDLLRTYVIAWESEKKYSAIQTLCKCWIEPIVKIHRDILPFLFKCSDDKSILYRSYLFCMVEKLGIQLAIENADNAIYLDHEDEYIRLNVFAAYCYKLGNFTNNDYVQSVNLVKHFLYFNATANTSYLREGIFNYFKIFLSNMIKRAAVEKDSKTIISFLEWLHEFEIDCFEIGSCYQRKIFGLNLYKMSLQFLCSNDCTDAILSKDPNFREAIKYGPVLQKEMEDSGKWRFTDKQSIVLLFKLVLDPATDIKEISSSIIIDFFDPNILTDAEKTGLFITAINKCNSCKFYETDCGAYLFKILTKWFPLNKLNKESLKLNSDFKSFCTIDKTQFYIRFLFDEAKHQLALANKDILKAATQNTPFYGLITALIVTGFREGPEHTFVTQKYLDDLMDVSEEAVNFFLNAFSSKSSNLEYSSSFEEMSHAINEAIRSSELNCEFDELILSPAQQAIITCIWRSLKALCELSVEIAKSKCANDVTIQRAGQLIVKVSLKCRHKGVIESAGVAIANLSRYLCKNEKNVELLEKYLEKLLNNDFSTSINLTRRGAGLTIMFHKIIASDVRSERPLLHYAVNSLIQSLRKSAAMKVDRREANNYDDPCAMRLHFLKTLVADKQLQSQLSPYFEQICLTCFEYMPSHVFTIRNASLQLFGATVSRLVGQNTGAKSLDFGYGYSMNHFVTHFPELAVYILSSLKACCKSLDGASANWRDSVNIIHVLSLLSKMFFSGCELIDGTAINYVKQIRKCIDLFLSSQVAYVRNLAAKCYAATVGLSSIDDEICQLKSRIVATSSFNTLNGLLCTLEYLYEKREDEFQTSLTAKCATINFENEINGDSRVRTKTELLWNFWCNRSVLIKDRSLCYVVEAQLLRLTSRFDVALKVSDAIEPREKHDFGTLFEKTRPGFFDFVDELMHLFVGYLSYNENRELIRSILAAKCIDFGINFLKHAPRNNRNLLMPSIEYALDNFDTTNQILLEELNIYANKSVRNIFREKVIVDLKYIDISRLKAFAEKMECEFAPTIQAYELLSLIHVMILRRYGAYDLFANILSNILNQNITLANYFSYPETYRELIAKNLEIQLSSFNVVKDKCRILPLLTSLALLKDEVYSIRETIRESVLNNVILAYKFSKGRVMDQVMYTTLLLNIVSEEPVVGKLNHCEVVEFFEKYLSTIEVNSKTFDIENPFDDNNITFYKEESKLINFIVFCICKKFSTVNFTKEDSSENISLNVFNTRRDLISKMNINLDNLHDVLNYRFDEYLARKLKTVKDIYLTIKQDE